MSKGADLSELASILIVDDQPEIRKVVRHILERDGRFAVAEAGGGDEALDLVESHAPDAVLLDVAMPGFNGVVVIRRLKEMAPQTKIVMLTSHFGMGDELIAMGADAFLEKTVSPKKLVRTLAELLGL